jgi:hypothetical protein
VARGIGQGLDVAVAVVGPATGCLLRGRIADERARRALAVLVVAVLDDPLGRRALRLDGAGAVAGIVVTTQAAA